MSRAVRHPVAAWHQEVGMTIPTQDSLAGFIASDPESGSARGFLALAQRAVIKHESQSR